MCAPLRGRGAADSTAGGASFSSSVRGEGAGGCAPSLLAALSKGMSEKELRASTFYHFYKV